MSKLRLDLHQLHVEEFATGSETSLNGTVDAHDSGSISNVCTAGPYTCDDKRTCNGADTCLGIGSCHITCRASCTCGTDPITGNSCEVGSCVWTCAIDC